MPESRRDQNLRESLVQTSYRKTSTLDFFEIFNKLKRKCAVLIPNTIIVNGGSVLAWYFTSKKEGVVLKKRFEKLNAFDVFKSFLLDIPAAAELGTERRCAPDA